MTAAPFRAYPEPPASSAWHRHRTTVRPLTAAEKSHNLELLMRAQHAPRPRSSRPTKTLTEAS